MAQRQATDHTFTLALTLTLDVKHTGRHTRHDELGALRLGPRYQSTDPIAHIPSDLPLALDGECLVKPLLYSRREATTEPLLIEHWGVSKIVGKCPTTSSMHLQFSIRRAAGLLANTNRRSGGAREPSHRRTLYR